MKDDLDRLMAVMEASFDPHYREAWTRKQVADSLTTPSTYMILINADGGIPSNGEDAAGFVLARQALDEIELLLIAVHPDHRGIGLGRALLRHFCDSARQRGAAQVFLEMRANNPAERLYRKEGFEQIGLRRDYYRTLLGSPIDALTFAKQL
ncbi:ribosomal protein S18-alanine N-acetyltransferase [Erythrobacter sp. SD-21]|uniref:ribosomal protein S18-alanine N-acetyltransferase n=1 Tax=Erythrobacter sp. SD-21 TaxID=161528 RepID=UPI000153FAB1|nr:ribosomal protein S18-alanine N-acetyltransferase [Erythrobacter sp. SD-21]EDL48139.1 acetyltransferase [Erythrobacter sp. SD-21]